MDAQAELPLLLALFALSMAVAAAAAYALRLHAAGLSSLDFSSLRFVLAAYIIAIAFIIDGWSGLAVLGISTVLGRITLALEVERTNLMGAIIVPTLMLLLRVFP
jgi:TctA family transporter